MTAKAIILGLVLVSLVLGACTPEAVVPATFPPTRTVMLMETGTAVATSSPTQVSTKTSSPDSTIQSTYTPNPTTTPSPSQTPTPITVSESLSDQSLDPINPVSNPEVFSEQILPNISGVNFQSGNHEIVFGIYNPTGRESWNSVIDSLSAWENSLDLPFNEETHFDQTKREVVGLYVDSILETGHESDRFVFEAVRGGNDTVATLTGVQQIDASWDQVQHSKWVVFYGDNRDIMNYFVSGRGVNTDTPLLGGVFYYDEENNTFYLGTVVGGENASGRDLINVHFPIDPIASVGRNACSTIFRGLVNSGPKAGTPNTTPFDRVMYGKYWAGDSQSSWEGVQSSGAEEDIIENSLFFCPVFSQD